MDIREVLVVVERQWAAMVADGCPSSGAEMVFKCDQTFEFRDINNGKILFKGVWR